MFHLLKTQRTLDGKFNISTEKQKKKIKDMATLTQSTWNQVQLV